MIDKKRNSYNKPARAAPERPPFAEMKFKKLEKFADRPRDSLPRDVF